MTGLPGIATLTDTPAESANLSDLWTTYKSGTEAATKTVRNTKRAWDDFVNFVNVKTCNDVTDDLVRDYRDRINGDPTYGEKTQSLIFSRVKAVVNATAKEKGSIVGTLPLKMRMLTTKAREGDEGLTLATPMTRATFHKLLDNADDRMRAMRLVGLNCAMYIAEVCDVKWTHVDLDAGTLVMRPVEDEGHAGGDAVA